MDDSCELLKFLGWRLEDGDLMDSDATFIAKYVS